MASQDILDLVKATSGKAPVSPSVQKVQQVQAAQPVSKPIVPTLAKPTVNSNASPQGKLFSGNWFQKAMDVPQLIQYGYSGFLKGGYNEVNKQKEAGTYNTSDLGQYAKNVGTRVLAGVKNIPTGIMNRTSIGREEGNVDVGKELGIKNPLVDTAYNLGLSLAVPSTPVGKVLKSTGISSAIGKGLGKVANVVRGIEPVAKAIETVNPYFRNPEVGKIIQESGKATQSRLNQVYKMVQTASKGITPEEQRVVGTVLENNAELLPQYKAKLQPIVDTIRSFSDEVGKEGVDLGLISKESFDALKGKYMTHIWNDGQKADNLFTSVSKAIPSIEGRFYKQRKGKEGYIQEFAPAVFKGLGTEVRNNEIAKLYKNIVDKFGMDVVNIENVANPENYVFAPEIIKNSKMGKAFGKTMIPKEVADYLTELAKTGDRNLFDKLYDFWKKGKTIYNPAYHVRNNISNQILSDMSTGEGVIPSAVGAVESARSIAGKGKQMFVNAAKDIGLIGRENFGEMYGKTLETAGLESGAKKTLGTILSKVDKGLTGFQNKSEEAAKLNVFTSWMHKFANEAKITVEEALQNPDLLNKAKNKAEEAIFSPYNISSKERGLVKKLGIPFYSFARQSIPFVGKTLLNNPERITKYSKYKTAIEGLTPEESGKPKPEFAKNSIRLPIKNKEGKNYSFDPSYIYPFGNLGEDSGGLGLPFGLSANPLYTEVAQQAANKDLYFGQPIAKSNIPEKATKQRVEHALRTFAPQLYSTIGLPLTGLPESRGKLYGAATGQPDYAGRTRSPVSAGLDALGFKNSVLRPEDQAKFNSLDKKEKIKSIQSERRTVLADKRLTPEEKRDIIEQLNKLMQQTLVSP